MSATDVQPRPKVDQKPRPERPQHRRPQGFKGYIKFGRKRAQSFPAGGGNGKLLPPYKRRKKDNVMIPPTKFLLGGNIYDPLNLNSMQDEEINRAMNAVTPKSSPVPTPVHRKGEVEVIIPPNLKDPLNLASCHDDAQYEQQLVSPSKRGRKSRNRKKKRNSSGGDAMEVAGLPTEEGASTGTVPPEPPDPLHGSAPPNPARRDLDLPLSGKACPGSGNKRPRLEVKDKVSAGAMPKRPRLDPMDKIVSPVIPQPGAWKRPQQGKGGPKAKKQPPPGTPKFKQKDAYFQYGNYNRYYGYRNPQQEEDTRLKVLQDHREMFQDKDVLDIGCNVGHITLTVGRDLGARTVVGVDIDKKLISAARRNVKHYLAGGEKLFPASLPLTYGHLPRPWVGASFPHNVTFIQGNYVLEKDELLAAERPQFDVILCLSITKWLHLNWGDAGLRRAFRRMFLQLRPGGRLVLEPQSWKSYKRKRNLTETIHKHYHTIELQPHRFTQYLLSSDVGFVSCEVLGTPFHSSRGFQRPIRLFTKAGGEVPGTGTSGEDTGGTAIVVKAEGDLDGSTATVAEVQMAVDVPSTASTGGDTSQHGSMAAGGDTSQHGSTATVAEVQMAVDVPSTASTGGDTSQHGSMAAGGDTSQHGSTAAVNKAEMDVQVPGTAATDEGISQHGSSATMRKTERNPGSSTASVDKVEDWNQVNMGKTEVAMSQEASTESVKAGCVDTGEIAPRRPQEPGITEDQDRAKIASVTDLKGSAGAQVTEPGPRRSRRRSARTTPSLEKPPEQCETEDSCRTGVN